MKTRRSTADDTDKLLSADEILNAQDTRYDTVKVPEWGGSVRIRTMAGDESLNFTESNTGPARKTAGIRLVALCAVDAEGNRLFTEKQLEALKRKSSVALSRVADAALRLNEMVPAAMAAAKNDSGEA